MTDRTPTFHPSAEELDDLEVLRRGLFGPGAPFRGLAVPHDLAMSAVTAGALMVMDAEGVPVARLEQPHLQDHHLSGTPHWLAEASGRPFAQYQLAAPQDLSGEAVVLVESLADVPDPVPDGAYLLVLASTGLDGPTAGNDVVRAALAGVLAARDARLGVVPAPPDPARRSALLTTLGLEPGMLSHPDRDASDPRPATAPAPRPRGVVVLLTGLSGSGKSTVARAVATRLVEDGTPVTLLDGDVVRRHLTTGLGFSAADRRTNVRRIGWVAAEIAHHRGIAVCSPIAPEATVRREMERMAQERGAAFVLVHVATPLEECERRDRKGLYAAARRGEIPDFTGISAPYDVPEDPDLRLDTTGQAVDACADQVLSAMAVARSGEGDGA